MPEPTPDPQYFNLILEDIILEIETTNPEEAGNFFHQYGARKIWAKHTPDGILLIKRPLIKKKRTKKANP